MGIRLSECNLSQWDLSQQNLSDADLSFSSLNSANLTGANLTGANLEGVDLQASNLAGTDLTGADFRNADMSYSTLTNATMPGANLTNANLAGTPLSSVTWDSSTIYNQGTIFPAGFDPAINGLTLALSMSGDFNADDALDSVDLEGLRSMILLGSASPELPEWLPESVYDLNGDQIVDREDHTVWVKDLFGTAFGDADLNGVFNANDLIRVFQGFKYRTGETAAWEQGDWNADGLFTSADLIVAFQDDGYSPPGGVRNAVPEPTAMAVLLAGLIGLAIVSHSRRKCV